MKKIYFAPDFNIQYVSLHSTIMISDPEVKKNPDPDQVNGLNAPARSLYI